MRASLLMSFLSGVLAVQVTAACAGSNTLVQTAPPLTLTPADIWHLTFHLSGGFAGFDRELRIDSTGELNASDRRRSQTASARATAGELTRLRSLVAKIPAAPQGDGGCRDCLIYEIHLATDTRSLTARLNDVNVSGSGLSELVEMLKDVLTRTLAR